MSNDTGACRRWWRRASTVISVGVATIAGIAAPAFAHPVFANDPPGFPNPQGSATTPYPAGSRPTVNMYLPFEQEGVQFNGAENTTVDVQVTIPAGWTSPACGAVSTLVPESNRQVGRVVPGWTCSIETVDDHQVLHWRGPQVGPPPKTFTDSAQFFTFQVTVPSPATQTSYGAAGGPEGLYVKQVYANGFTSLWRTPNSTRPGEVANGIVRTVSNSTAPPNPTGPPATTPPEHSGSRTPAPTTRPGGSGSTPTPAPRAGGSGSSPTPAGRAGGGGSTATPAGQPSPSGSPGATAQGIAAPATIEPSPGAGSPRSAATEQLAQRDDAVRWPILVGIVLAVVIAVGAVVVVVRRRWLGS